MQKDLNGQDDKGFLETDREMQLEQQGALTSGFQTARSFELHFSEVQSEQQGAFRDAE